MEHLSVNFSGICGRSFRKMRGQWGGLIGAGLCYNLIMGSANNLAGGLLATILLAPMTAGWTALCLCRMRGQEIRVGMIFEKFDDYGRFVWGVLRPVLFIILWGLLFIVPGIIAALRYSQSLMLLIDDPSLEARGAMEQSIAMMKGYKLRLFGYGLLLGIIIVPATVLTLGIILFWVVPYVQCFYAEFYLSLKAEKGLQTEPVSGENFAEASAVQNQ